MARAAESFFHGGFGSDEQIRIAPHVAGNQHRLAELLVSRGYLRMTRSEGAGRAFAMDAESALLTLDDMLFNFRNIVADVVNQ